MSSLTLSESPANRRFSRWLPLLGPPGLGTGPGAVNQEAEWPIEWSDVLRFEDSWTPARGGSTSLRRGPQGV